MRCRKICQYMYPAPTATTIILRSLSYTSLHVCSIVTRSQTVYSLSPSSLRACLRSRSSRSAGVSHSRHDTSQALSPGSSYFSCINSQIIINIISTCLLLMSHSCICSLYANSKRVVQAKVDFKPTPTNLAQLHSYNHHYVQCW
jgi:hypothetical protein